MLIYFLSERKNLKTKKILLDLISEHYFVLNTVHTTGIHFNKKIFFKRVRIMLDQPVFDFAGGEEPDVDHTQTFATLPTAVRQLQCCPLPASPGSQHWSFH